MAALNLEEQEQLDALKAWWKENSSWILGTLIIAIVATAGWRGWNSYKNGQAIEAAALYQQVVEQVATQDTKRVNDAADAVKEKFASSAYAARAALLAAQVNEEKQDVAHAKLQLQWVVDNATEAGLKVVAKLRLAALLLDEKNYAEALKQLEGGHPASFDGLYSDLRGDIFNAQGKKEQARSAYKLAYEKLSEARPYRNLVQMKLDSLGSAE